MNESIEQMSVNAEPGESKSGKLEYCRKLYVRCNRNLEEIHVDIRIEKGMLAYDGNRDKLDYLIYRKDQLINKRMVILKVYYELLEEEEAKQ